MHISNEGLLTQLGYHANSANLIQLENIAKSTSGYEQIKRHILALHDHLKNFEGFVALSNSKPYFKIKIETDDPNILQAALDELFKWAHKYNVNLQKVEGKETYYITGIQKD
ncbi:hypothetical protein [Nitratiruptor sp. YY09-18]|uniref:hypothetical protein n=1 Tax=Nitratiruptor sp. YY09-18 TaxID=2724901 RepID=UPI001915CEB5|nr:hypothetical protein [Nitratiruptor sp. YY09-18]BCD67595.1 hypothetical protein NitYY0918_C0494 [Nitratiruptor sp. YY09-18]